MGMRFITIIMLLVSTLLATATLKLEKTASPSGSVASGSEITYTIRYTCASTQENCDNVVITDALPGTMQYVKHYDSTDVSSSNESSGTVTWTFGSVLEAGSTGELRIIGRIPSGTTANGTTFDNTVNATVDSVPQTPSTASVTATASAQWSVNKSHVAEDVWQSGFYANRNVTYSVQVCPNGSSGNLDLSDFSVTDTLDPRATYVSGGTYDAATHRVTWSALGAKTVSSGCWSDTVTVLYDEENNASINIGDTVTNNAHASVTDINSNTHTIFATPLSNTLETYVFNGVPQISLSKSASVSGTTKGSDGTNWLRDDEADYSALHVTYTLTPKSTGNINLENFVMLDDVDESNIDVTQITTGVYSGTGLGGTYTVEYYNGSWQTLGTPAFGASTTYSGLSNVQQIRFNYGNVPVDFDTTTPPTLSGDITTSTPQSPVYTIPNTATLSADGNATQPDHLTANASADVYIRDSYSQPTVSKSGPSGEVNIGETVTFSITVSNSSSATQTMENPIVSDLLPVGFTFNGMTGATTCAIGTPAGVTGVSNTTGTSAQLTTDFHGDTSQTHLLWAFTGAFERGESCQLVYTATIDNTANEYTGESVNKVFISADPEPNDGRAYACSTSAQNGTQSGAYDESTFGYDLNNDSDTTDMLCQASALVTILDVTNMSSQKWVKGALDSDWTRLPNTGKTLHGGQADYNMTIANNGNVAVSNIQIIDILPIESDHGVLAIGEDRTTSWRPNLAELPDLSAFLGAVVKYSLSTNPCRGDGDEADFDVNDPTCEDPEWRILSDFAPTDLSQIRSIWIDFKNSVTLDGSESFSFYWKMFVPVDAPTGDVAWNSFAFKAQRIDNSWLLPSEPLRVGIEVFAESGDDNNSVGDYIWLDIDDDDVQDSEEPGMNGIDVELYSGSGCSGSAIDTTVTATDYNGNMGAYRFVNLPNGSYSVKIIAPANYAFTDNTTGSKCLDSVALSGTQEDDTLDAGLNSATHYALGDYVWYDTPSTDGIQNDSNDSYSVTVKLFDESDTLIDITATTKTGRYLFYGIDPSTNYYVEFVPPTGFGMTYDNQGSDDTLDSDANITMRTPLFGFESNPSGEDGSFDANTVGNVNLSVDAGLTGTATVGNFIFYDRNYNGIKNSGEDGILGVDVTLWRNIDGAVVATQTTGSNGVYLFEYLTPGDYNITFDWSGVDVSDDPSHPYLLSTFSSGDNHNNGISTGVDSAKIVNIPLSIGSDDRTRDIGLYRQASIGNFVWLDYDGDGLQDAESGVDGVSVSLYNSADALQGTTTTSSGGTYLFDNLNPGGYYLVFSDLPAGHVVALKDQGGNDNADSDANLVAPHQTATTTLTSNEDDMSWDMGIYIPASLGNYVWEDYNINGIQEAGENSVSGIDVYLYYASDTNTYLSSTTTDSNGIYSFTGLRPDSYVVGFDAQDYLVTLLNLGGDDTADSDITSTQNSDGYYLSSAETLVSGENNETIDGGLYEYASLGNRVWYDNNRNGIQDGAEHGVANVEVYLLDNGGIIRDTNTTDSNGLYMFSDIMPGTYSVEFNLSTLPASYYVVSQQDQGGDDTADSDADTVSGKTASVTLYSGDVNTTFDMGVYVKQTGLGDTVWHDSNANGIQDSGEEGVNGIEVCLEDTSGNSVNDANGTAVACTTTDANGHYDFINLDPGNYKVHFTLPTGYVLSPKSVGSNHGIDSDVNVATMLSDTITLVVDTFDPDWDMGIYRLGSIGDTVWHDDNADQTLDGSESGISGVSVVLKDHLGTVVDTQITDGNGNYLFEGLKPDTYSVSVDESTLPSSYNWAITTYNNPLTYTLAPEEDYVDADFGYDYDKDGDGIPDDVEEPEDDDGDGTPNDEDEDSDNDGKKDIDEGTGDRDGDGIPDYRDYDPSGWFYNQEDGEVIPGGSINITCNNGATASPANQTSGDGSYAFGVSNLLSSNICSMDVTPPSGWMLSDDYNASSTPCLIASGDTYAGQDKDAGNHLATSGVFDIAANQPYCFDFEIDQNSGNLYFNNIPLKKAPLTVPSLTDWGRLLMLAVLLLVGFYHLKRRNTAAYM